MADLYDIVCIGEVLIDMFADEVGLPLIESASFHRVPGGAPANVAVAAAKQGARSAFIGKVGNDAFGHYLVRELASYGVQTHAIRFDNEARTCLNFQTQLADGSAELLFYRNPSADMRLQPDELDHEMLQQTRAFNCSAISLSTQPSRDATHAALHIARNAGALIAFDVNYRPTLWPSADAARKEILSVLALADVVKINQDELLLLTGSDDAAAGTAQLLGLGPSLCVATLGPNGSYYRYAGGGDHVPSLPIKPVETTGSGDAFNATLITQLVTSNLPWREQLTDARLRTILRRTNAAGAFTALRRGVFPALPTTAALDSFMQE